MKYEYIYMDTEFGNTNKRYISVICVSIVVEGVLESYDVRDEDGKDSCKKFLSNLPAHLTPILVSYNIDAEVRALFSIYKTSNLSELPFKHYICLQREHRMLANKYKDLVNGKVIEGDKGLTTRPFKPEQSSTPADFKYVNLLNALYKFLGVYEEEHLKYKTLYRDICIRQNPSEIEVNIAEIMKYCEMDTKLLPQLHAAIDGYTRDRFRSKGILDNLLPTQQLRRGAYGAIIAEKGQDGYTIDMGKYYNILGVKQQLVNNLCEKINKRWPDKKTFEFDIKQKRYIFKRPVVAKYIETQLPVNFRKMFPRTIKKNEMSISLEVLGRIYGDINNNLDESDYLQQIYKYLRTVSSLSGLTRHKEGTSGAKTFRHYLDPEEGVVRPYYNDFGSSTGRSQPAANGYLLAKPAWMRSLLTPPANHIMVAADFGKQEILFLACLAQDENLIAAYASGDPYVQFGKGAKLLNMEGKGTAKWEIERSACKQAVLAMFYGMAAFSLANKLTVLRRRKVEDYEAQRYIDAFKRLYPKVDEWKRQQVAKHKKQGFLMLRDGWAIWKNSYNKRSIINFEVQGGCGVVMRESEFRFRKEGYRIPMTLHDGFYVYFPLKNGRIDYGPIATLIRCLRDSFIWGLGGVRGSDLIDIDLKIVGDVIRQEPHYPHICVDGKKYPLDYAAQYKDKRAETDLKEFGKYMDIQPSINTNTVPIVRI